MREYKFRGKPTKNNASYFEEKEFVYGSLVIANDKHYILLDVLDNIKRDDYEVYMIEVIAETVGQYTELKDKNGKEIYEGDIVYIAAEDERGIIRWDNETARYVVIYDNIITDFDNWYGEDLEVIGNIYDNPELLEKGE